MFPGVHPAEPVVWYVTEKERIPLSLNESNLCDIFVHKTYIRVSLFQKCLLEN